MDFESGLDDATQMMRGAFLQYFLTFLRELIPHPLLRELSQFVVTARKQKNHDSFGWLALLHINAGLFHYTGDDRWIDHALGNLGHHNSGVRDRVAYALAMCADRLDGFDPRILSGIQANFRKRHLGNGMQLSLFIAARGEIPSKQEQLGAWTKRFGPEVCGQREMTAWLRGGYIANPFAPWTRMFERYILMRLATPLQSLPIQLITVPGYSAVDGGQQFQPDSALSGSELFVRLDSHPLSNEYLGLIQNAYPGDIFRPGEVWSGQASKLQRTQEDND